LLFLIVLCLQWGRPGCFTVALLLFIAAMISDWLDGWAARRQGLVTHFGIFMDALADKILILGLFSAFFMTGVIPGFWYWGFLLILTREFLITGLRLIAASRRKVLPAEKAGKWKTAIQMIGVCFLLAGEMGKVDFPAWGWQGAAETIGPFFHTAGVVFFVIGLILTVYSGSSYLHRHGYVFRES